MPFLGDLERFVATSIYPYRFAIAGLAMVALACLAIVAARRGWVAGSRRHPARTGLVALVAALVILPAAWYLGSPLLIRTELNEPPVAVAASPEPGASALLLTPAPASPPSAVAAPLGPSPTPAPATKPTPAATPSVTSGVFSGADDFHFGRGSATLTLAPDGRSTLRFDNFSVRNGPDLYVYLSPDPSGYAVGAIELGRLRATDGSFNTKIPPGVDVKNARSVVIWCKEFAVQFAVAPLDG
jgi:hypothetical protein